MAQYAYPPEAGAFPPPELRPCGYLGESPGLRRRRPSPGVVWEAIRATSDASLPYVGVNQGVIHILVDGQPSLMVDHFGAISEGMETVGDE